MDQRTILIRFYERGDSYKSYRRVIRGGSWNDVAANCRSAFRAPDDAEDGHDDLGFRVVCQDVDNPRAEAVL